MKVRDIVLIGILSASLTAGKLALSFIPNVEIVTLLFIAYTVVFGARKTLFIAIVFSTTEIFIYGFSTWLIGYYIIWPLLVLAVSLLKGRVKTEYAYAAIAGVLGYGFGLFFAIVESFFYGIAYGWTYFLSGIPFDILHGTSNVVILLILFKPMVNILNRLKAEYYNV